MADIERLIAEGLEIEKELMTARIRLQEAKEAAERNPDELNLKGVDARQGVVTALEQKSAENQRLIAEQRHALPPTRPLKKPTDLDDDEHLTERSTLRYGSVIDLNDLDIDEPSGASANWVAICTYILGFGATILLKALYMLTTRGRQTIKEHKGNRVRFRDDSSFIEKGGVKVPKHLYVSLPTAQSAIKAEELTPGRFRTIVCGLYPSEAKVRGLISPVMGVIGFQYLAQNWSEMIHRFMHMRCPFIENPGLQVDSALLTNQAYFEMRGDALEKIEAVEMRSIREEALDNDRKLINDILQPDAPWLFAGAPDRCPPTSLYVAGIPELGAFLALMQDVRNAIMASKMTGTVEEKVKRKSSFYQSYMRRTQSMGMQMDQRIIHLFVMAWGKLMIDHFNLGDDMDPALRQMCQALLDEKVKEICNNEPMRL
uniref:Nucleoprotein n=1 Tax=Nova virus TaxID=660955 RepID=A0A1B1LUP3_9VIRU|nr:nucleocapsid protein [Nova virus]